MKYDDVGPGNVWILRDPGNRPGYSLAVLLVEEVTKAVSGDLYRGEPCWRGLVVMDAYNPEFEGSLVSYTRSHLFRVFERLI
jgi:hypothetical protein